MSNLLSKLGFLFIFQWICKFIMDREIQRNKIHRSYSPSFPQNSFNIRTNFFRVEERIVWHETKHEERWIGATRTERKRSFRFDPSKRRDVGGVPLITRYSPWLFPRSTMRRQQADGIAVAISQSINWECAADNREYNTRVLVGGLRDNNRSRAASIFITLDKSLPAPLDPQQSAGNCIDR